MSLKYAFQDKGMPHSDVKIKTYEACRESMSQVDNYRGPIFKVMKPDLASGCIRQTDDDGKKHYFYNLKGKGSCDPKWARCTVVDRGI